MSGMTGREVTGGEPRRTHDALLFEDVITIVLTDDSVGRFDIQSLDEIPPTGD